MQGDSQKAPEPSAPAGGQWQYTPEGNDGVPSPTPEAFAAPGPQATPAKRQEVSWSASEFVSHQKSGSWYIAYALIAIAITAALYLVTRDMISIVAVVGMIVLFGVTVSRQPRTLTYELDRGGLTIGQKFYPYTDFKSYAVITEGAFSSLYFMPMKRFMPPLSVYYDPADEPAILEVLNGHLPFTEDGHDPIDRLARRLRF